MIHFTRCTYTIRYTGVAGNNRPAVLSLAHGRVVFSVMSRFLVCANTAVGPKSKTVIIRIRQPLTNDVSQRRRRRRPQDVRCLAILGALPPEPLLDDASVSKITAAFSTSAAGSHIAMPLASEHKITTRHCAEPVPGAHHVPCTYSSHAESEPVSEEARRSSSTPCKFCSVQTPAPVQSPCK